MELRFLSKSLYDAFGGFISRIFAEGLGTWLKRLKNEQVRDPSPSSPPSYHHHHHARGCVAAGRCGNCLSRWLLMWG
eukprot:COSAG04_NODE_345_length_16159_cov_5.383126_5_plen_77_part_00